MAQAHLDDSWYMQVAPAPVAYIQVEKDEEYIKSVTALGAVIEDLVKANNAVDIYEDYFAGQV